MVHFEIVEYHPAGFLGIALWTPFAYGLATVVAVLLFTFLDRLLGDPVEYTPSYLAFEYMFIAGFFICILFFKTYPYLLTIGLFVVILIRVIFFHEPWDFLFFLIGACVGPTIELALTSFHLYLFNDPDFLGMPYWLGLLWGGIALSLRRVGWVLNPPRRQRSVLKKINL